jgi:hypothetical protein
MKTTLLIILLLASNACADEQLPKFVSDLSFRTGWVSYRLRFTDADFANSPVWKPGTDEPALLPNDAYSRARDALKKLRPDDWQLYSPISVGLTRQNEDAQVRFYYYINYYRFSETDKLTVVPPDPAEERIMMFVVLLNGRVIAPNPVKVHR